MFIFSFEMKSIEFTQAVNRGLGHWWYLGGSQMVGSLLRLLYFVIQNFLVTNGNEDDQLYKIKRQT